MAVDLTNLERQMLVGMSHGLTNSDIATWLKFAPATIKGYITGLYAKLDADNRAHAVRKGFERGLLTVDDRSSAATEE